MTELLPVAFKVRLPEVKLEEILSAPVKEFPLSGVQGALAEPALLPERVKFPVPAFAIMLTGFQVPEDPFLRSRVIAPFDALVSKVKMRELSASAPIPPLIVISEAVMDVFMRLVVQVPSAVWIIPDRAVAVDVVMFTVPLWVMFPCRKTVPLD